MDNSRAPFLLLIALTASSTGVSMVRRASANSCVPAEVRTDTLRFVGISRSSQFPGALRLWTDSAGHLSYSEVLSYGEEHYLWTGTIHGIALGEETFTARRFTNGVLTTTESVERVGDSVITVRDGKRSITAVARSALALPELMSSVVRVELLLCALQRPSGEMQTARFGRVHAESVASTSVRTAGRTIALQLYLLRSGSGAILFRAWLDAGRHVVALPFADGALDFVRPEWVGARDQLLEAEVRASSPNCHSGFGLGSCEPSPRICNLPSSTETRAEPARSVTIDDSGFAIRSDGRGPYRGGSANVVVPPVGLVAGILLTPESRDAERRSFLIDLSRPVPGDIGKPLGVRRVDGRIPGRFAPSGSDFISELVAHANTDWDQRQRSLASVPVGGRMTLSQFDVEFYIGDVLHVLQMGPQPYGHCYSAGTAVYGDRTTAATMAHPDSSRWVIELPPGSVARLFENRHGDPTAVNRGLYYVSLRLVIEK